jgi:carbamoyl-phosphate synthase large subunit
VPRFAFEKFPAADPTLTTTMKSVGEAMALGRNFTEALQKALRSMEKKPSELPLGRGARRPARPRELLAWHRRSRPTAASSEVQQALRVGPASSEVHEATGIDPWFLDQIASSTRSPSRVRTPSG